MNVLENIKQAIELLEQNEEYYSQLLEFQSKTDKKIDFWEHYIELNSIPVTQAYKIIKEIKKLRMERRIYKNDYELIRTFKDNEAKMQNYQNRKMLLNQVCKTKNRQNNAKYGYEAYTEEEVKEILGIKEEEE